MDIGKIELPTSKVAVTTHRNPHSVWERQMVEWLSLISQRLNLIMPELDELMLDSEGYGGFTNEEMAALPTTMDELCQHLKEKPNAG